MSLPEADLSIVSDLKKILKKFRKSILVFYVGVTLFGCYAAWFSFKHSQSLVVSSLYFVEIVVITCIAWYCYRRVSTVLDKVIERENSTSTTQIPHLAAENMTAEAMKNMKKAYIGITVSLRVLLFVSLLASIMFLIHNL